MRLAFGEHTVEVHSWETKQALLDFLSTCEAGSVVLGAHAEQHKVFYSAYVHLGWSGLRRFGIGVCSEGHGLVPHLFLQPERLILIVGFNSEVVAVNVQTGKIGFQFALDALFRSFVFLSQHKVMLIFHEIGVLAVSECGEELWRYDRDTIESCVISEERLRLQFLDAPPVQLSITSGTVGV